MGRHRPWWAAPALWKKMKGVERVELLGVSYELPVTPETEPFIRVLRGERNPWPPGGPRGWRRRYKAEDGMRDIVAALLVQVRDTVGHQVAQNLQQEIGERMYPLIKARVDREIEAREPHRLGRKEGGDGK